MRVSGRDVAIAALPLIFEQQARRGLEPGEPAGDRLLEAVHIYHPISTEEQSSYRKVLVAAYQAFHQRRPQFGDQPTISQGIKTDPTENRQ